MRILFFFPIKRKTELERIKEKDIVNNKNIAISFIIVIILLLYNHYQSRNYFNCVISFLQDKDTKCLQNLAMLDSNLLYIIII